MRQLIKALSMLGILATLLQFGCGNTRSGGVASGDSASGDRQQIVKRISGIVGRQLDIGVNEVDVNLPLAKLKKPADDLDVVEIIMSTEEAFDIEIKDEDIGSDVSVKKLADIVSQKKAP